MGSANDPFRPLPDPRGTATPGAPCVAALLPLALSLPAPSALTTARLHAFDIEDRPLLSGLPAWPGQLVAARTTVPLRRAMLGDEVLVAYADADPSRPIVIGVLQRERAAPAAEPAAPPPAVSVQADGERQVLQAEREIVLRCGDASITLTRAGKVIIEGHYILSRSTGYNRIKGAAVDIN